MEFVTKYRGNEVVMPSAALKRAASKLSPRKLQQLIRSSEFEMRKYFTAVSDDLHRRHGSAWPGGTGPESLSRRSGAGLRSVKNFMVKGTGEGATGYFRLNRYMAFHERGGWIRAKSAKFLTIPLPAALNANGTPRQLSARQWQGTFIARSRAGNLIIFQKRGREIVPLYVLKKSVRIRARLGLKKTLVRLRPSFRRGMVQRINELMKD